MQRPFSALLGLFLLLLGGTAAAQEPAVPKGTGGQAPATSGVTEIVGQGKFATAAVVPMEEESEDVTDFVIAAGGILSTGNARAVAATSALNLRVRRDRHQFSSVFAGNYGAAAQSPEDGYEPNVANFQGRMRYDIFLAKRWSAFFMLTGRNDRFQGLDFRLNVDPGVAYHILVSKNHRLWVEAGYDFQYDIRSHDAILARDDDGNPILDMDGRLVQASEKTAIVHAARLFAGYSNHLSEQVSFDTGIEYLQSVTDGKVFRVIWDNALTAQLVKSLAVSATVTLRYENNPLPEIRRLDTISALNLVYRFF